MVPEEETKIIKEKMQSSGKQEGKGGEGRGGEGMGGAGRNYGQ